MWRFRAHFLICLLLVVFQASLDLIWVIIMYQAFMTWLVFSALWSAFMYSKHVLFAQWSCFLFSCCCYTYNAASMSIIRRLHPWMSSTDGRVIHGLHPRMTLPSMDDISPSMYGTFNCQVFGEKLFESYFKWICFQLLTDFLVRCMKVECQEAIGNKFI